MDWAAIGKGADAGLKTFNSMVPTISSLINNRRNRELRERELVESGRQFDLSHLLDKAKFQQDRDEYERSANMSAIDLLAKNRANAFNQFGRRQLKDSYFRG